ncbi:hypothetical protein [Alteromonas sp. ASW11-130]|uniref:hypothetical protein n=1 Tax=Alteromonas sp. ASW11-130 TaxID=3015775 RepID=UPI0022429FB0|nr:hypothetical protein [Alteromonas sp. ASW11-130]MCW8093178.1 hypothetical protein [Alteromonas sp. ASW11-130]
MKLSITLILTISVLLAGCSQQPSYDFMVDNFNENKPSFSMIATLACELGQTSGLPSYAIRGETDEEKILLELAERVNVQAIRYKEANGKCQLTMPVWEGEAENKHPQFVYRYNLHQPRPYHSATHRYQQLIKMADDETINNGPVVFDMKLSERWFFSFIYS